MLVFRLALAAAVAVLVALPLVSPSPRAAAQSGGAGAAAPALSAAEFFPETGFRLADERFALYFNARGGVSTFGYPTSRRLFLLGTPVQFFQRHVMQLQGDGRVTLLNLLDPGLLPFTSFGDATLPAQAPNLALGAPLPGAANYADAASFFIATTVPNDWGGLPVGFLDAFLAPGRAAGAPDPISQVLIGLELFGFPTSHPAPDPDNANFVYQRFQRTVLHYDATTRRTQPLLLADYLKALLTGRNVPPALAEQAATMGSPFVGQYNPARPGWLLRPELLPGTDLSGAFEGDDRGPIVSLGALPPVYLPPQLPGQGVPGVGGAGPAGAAPFSAAAPVPAAQTPTPLPSPTPMPTTGSVQPTPSPTVTPNPAVPVIERIEPGGAPIGRDVTLRGKNFGDAAGHVLFTGKLTTASIWSDTHIIVTVPDGALDGTVRIRRPDGAFSNEVGFAPQPTPTAAEATAVPTNTATATPGPPTITQLLPYQGAPGSSFIVQGSSFGSVTGQVLMGSDQASIDSSGWADTSIAARVPSDMGAGITRVIVRRGTDGQLSSHACYRVLQPTSTATATPGNTPVPTATATAVTSC